MWLAKPLFDIAKKFSEILGFKKYAPKNFQIISTVWKRAIIK
jgi:hypothetical protein